MSDTKKKSPTESEVAEDKIASQEMPAQETINNLQVTDENEIEKGFLGGVAEKGNEFGDIIVDKLKKGLSRAYEAGAKVVDELSLITQEYTEKYKAESEINKLKHEKDKLMTQLGQSIFKHHIKGGQFAESFFNKEEMLEQFNQIDMLDKKIIEIGKLLDKGKD